MAKNAQRRTAAFTLVEIMIVVAIIGLLVVLALPSFLKARKQSQGRRILNDARQMDSAVDQWAVEYNKKDGDAVDTVAAATYLKSTWKTKDVLGHDFVLNPVGASQVNISATTKSALTGVGIDWSSY
jgi:prepilin-type N-terminal cleavage/methylation domain-containing protein